MSVVVVHSQDTWTETFTSEPVEYAWYHPLFRIGGSVPMWIAYCLVVILIILICSSISVCCIICLHASGGGGGGCSSGRSHCGDEGGDDDDGSRRNAESQVAEVSMTMEPESVAV